MGLLVRTIQLRIRSLLLTAGFGALGVIAAGFNGGSYLNYHQDFSSMIMASGFAVAAVSYLIGLYVLPRSPISSGEPVKSPAWRPKAHRGRTR